LKNEPPVVLIGEEIPFRPSILEIERITTTRDQPQADSRRDGVEKSFFERERAGLTGRAAGREVVKVAF
jgi:hypothetical protein